MKKHTHQYRFSSQTIQDGVITRFFCCTFPGCLHAKKSVSKPSIIQKKVKRVWDGPRKPSSKAQEASKSLPRVRTAKKPVWPQKQKAQKVRKPIRKVSESRKVKNQEYMRLREEFMSQHQYCQVIFPEFAPHFHLCANPPTECHHKRGRGKFLLDVSTFLACCSTCHEWIHQNPATATERGYLIPNRG